MKNFLLLLLLTSLFTSCEDDPYKDPDNVELPSITMEGKNTFGCKVNGKVWVPYVENPGLFNQKFEETIEPPSITFQAKIRKDEDKIQESIFIRCAAIDTGIYNSYHKTVFVNTNLVGINDCYKYNVETFNSKIQIIKLDFNQRIVAGTFSYKDVYNECGDTIQITEGRFDIRY